jgi:murein DD-endopeptidase MepM/ murein hydrolase activator NlpD
MQDVPVLAPQSGQVFFLGFRVDAGITLLVRHADGRVSGLMHLAKAVVGPDEPVRQGQVVGYAGSTGSSGNPHLHFFVQPNAVERACVELNALDDINYTRMTATSRNLAWPALALPDPPSALPLWLPTLSAARPVSDVVLPTNVLLEPGTSVRVPVAVTGALAAADSLITAGRQITPALRTTSFAVFEVPLLTAQPPGTYTQSLRLTGRRVTTKTVTLNYEVRAPADTRPSLGLIPLSPNFLGPTSWARLRRSPELCWLAAPNSGQPPFQFRVMIVGPGAVDSGWIGKTCWQTPALEPGTYYWKVFVRDVQGRMNRTNQRPYAFVIRGQ